MTKTQPDLANLAAVVTGSSRGIGRAIAYALAEGGADVAVHAGHNRDAAEETAAEIARRGRQTAVLLADLAAPDQVRQLVADAFGWRDIQIWVNNAGADVLTGPLAAADFLDKLEQLWRVDVRGAILASRLAVERMLAADSAEAGEGDPRRSVVNIGWDQAAHGMAGDAGQMFAAIKGAVTAFTRSLAQTAAPRVRVNLVAPGWIQTAWGASTSDYWNRRACAESLLQRWGRPADVAEAVRFLVSPAAAFINGQVLPVNGGFRQGCP